MMQLVRNHVVDCADHPKTDTSEPQRERSGNSSPPIPLVVVGCRQHPSRTNQKMPTLFHPLIFFLPLHEDFGHYIYLLLPQDGLYVPKEQRKQHTGHQLDSLSKKIALQITRPKQQQNK